MKRPSFLLVGFAFLITSLGIGFASQESATLPPLEKCQAESLQLRATVVNLRQQLVQRETELAQQAMGREQERLEGRFRELLKPAEGMTFDWQTLTFKPPTSKE